MFEAGDILRAIAQTNERDRSIYLNAVDRVQESNAASQAQSITSILLKTKTRAVGLRFIIEYLSQCPKSVLEKKANIWLTVITKACNKNEVNIYGELIYEALALLLFQIQAIPDIAKWFGANLLGKLYESLCVVEKQKKVSSTIAALKSVKHCLRFYPGPSKFEKPRIMRFLLTLLDSSDTEVVFQCGVCWLLLQQLRSSNVGNSNPKTQWQEFQFGLLGSLNFLLIDINRNFGSDNIALDTSCKLEYFTLQLEGDPVERVARMSRRFCNLIEFLKIALSQPFPSTKLISPTKVLCFIQSGMELGQKNVVSNQSMENICLRNLLPTIHSKLLDLLEVLIDTCHSHLRMHFRLLLNILLESLNRTTSSSPGFEIQHCNLRVKVYDIIRLWSSSAEEGSGCDLIADRLVKDIFKDVTLQQTNIYLLSTSDPKIALPRALKKTRNASEPVVQNGTIENKGKTAVCEHALRCLQELLTSVGNLLKPQISKVILSTILEIAIRISEKQITIQSPYDDWNCRLQLYKTLFTFIYIKNMSCPLPRNICLYLLDESCKNEASLEVRKFLQSINVSLERTLHPERESLMFSTDASQHLSANTTDEAHQIQNVYKYKQINTKTDLPLMDLSVSLMPNTSVPESEPLTPEILQNEIKVTGTNEKFAKMPAIKDVNLNSHENDTKLELPLKHPSDEIKQCSEVQLNPVNEVVTNCQDDDYIEELNAAFVDELK